MSPEIHLKANQRTLMVAGGVLVVLIVYVWLADFWGVLGGILFGGLTGAVVAGGTGLYQVLFAPKS